jgi:hypothetical protein
MNWIPEMILVRQPWEGTGDDVENAVYPCF